MRFAIAILGLVAFAGQAHGQTYMGQATAIDGDTLELGDERIGLFGIDAPEADQTCEREGILWNCGSEATARLQALVANQPLRCESRARDTYGRIIATCRAGRLDLALSMVEQGFATVFDDAPGEYMRAAERIASLKLGIWNSDFMTPAEWRAVHPREVTWKPPSVSEPLYRAPRQQASRAPQGCLIKGNRNRRGEWIYHLPGRPYYEQTNAEEWFCTEAEARKAGYRASRAR